MTFRFSIDPVRSPSALSASNETFPAEGMTEIMKPQSIGGLGRAEEVAAAVLWLCSPAASFVIGVGLPVDGGFTAH